MQDQPAAHELIAAVAEFIERELLPTLGDVRLRFRGLVAANVLAVVARELVAGDEALREEWRRLALLLGQPADDPPGRPQELRDALITLSRELCVQIRAGAADEGPFAAAVFQHAQATVVEKLRVANPRYLSRVEN